MTDPDLRRVIVEHLTRPVSSRQADEIARGEPEPARPVARVVRGNVVTADPATIEFVKGRGTDYRQPFAVRFIDQQGHSWLSLVAAERNVDGTWAAHGVACGRGSLPQRSAPWLNLAGQWGQGRLYAGGAIHAAGAAVMSVSLTLEDGTILEADAEDDVALFISDHDKAPASVSIFDSKGRLLATHDA